MKFVGFGDMLACLNTPGYERFLQAEHFDISYSGAEANVCVALAMLGAQTEHVTRLPVHDIADCAEATLHKYGVSTTNTLRGGDRMGVLYMEKGASQRPSKVIYDRKHTAFSESQPGCYNWDKILAGADWFHFSGVTAALSESMPEVLREALSAAKSKNVKVSCDLNYRSKLWSPEQAQKVMTDLMPFVDLLIGNEEDAEKSLGISAEHSDVNSGKLDHIGYKKVAAEICSRFKVKYVAFSLRESISASDNGWGGMLYTEGEAHFSRKYAIHLVDRVGGGDAFSAGVLYGLSAGFDPQKAIDFAAALSCLKQTTEKDYSLSSLDEVLSLMNGSGSGRVQR